MSTTSFQVFSGSAGPCQPAHSAETFLSLPYPLVNLTLSSLARATMAFLHNWINALREWMEGGEEGCLSLDCGSSSTLQNLPGLHWEALSNLTGVDAVVHQKQFDVFFVSDEELLEARFELISGFLVLLAANLGFSDLASEASPHSGVNTSLLSPRSLKNKSKRDVSNHR